ncbi:MAG: hypothetical protein QOD00_3846 [Blastocatellia bacterium]|nr:hypothetical protein [Blastocatellia bacterium]
MSRAFNPKRLSTPVIVRALIASLLSVSGVLPATRAQERIGPPEQRKLGSVVTHVQPASCNMIQNGDFSAGLNVVPSNSSIPPSTVANLLAIAHPWIVLYVHVAGVHFDSFNTLTLIEHQVVESH